VAEEVNLGYIINDEQEEKGSCPQAPAREKEAKGKEEGAAPV